MDRLQSEVTEYVKTLEEGSLRAVKMNMFECGWKCYKDKRQSNEAAERCVESCSAPLMGAQEYVQSEMNSFQDRVNRCALDCQDKAKDGMTAGIASRSEVEQQFKVCADVCGETHIAMLTDIFKRIDTNLKKNKY